MVIRQPWPLDELPLVGGPDLPLGIFWPPHPYEITLERYQEIAAAGMTFLITGNYMFDQYINRRALDLAAQAGLKVLVNAPEPRLSATTHTLSVTDDPAAPLRISPADTTRLVQQMVDDYRRYPAFAGFDVYDEPPQAKFPTAAAVTAAVRSVAPDLLAYSNLVPGNGATYAAMVARYIDTVAPPVLSFDRYPILTGGVIDLNYFDNWAIIRRAGLAAGIPTWVYLQSVKYARHELPTEAQLRWQANISLAYGAKGILYFTYWTPDPARGEAFESAIITRTGERTHLYEAAATLNTQWLTPVGRELKPLVSVSVTHANENPLPPGTEPFVPDEYVRAVEGGAVVVGQFRSATDDGSRWVLVVNRSDRAETTVRLTFGSSTRSAGRFHAGPMGYKPARGSAFVQLAAGGAALFQLDGAARTG
ncbi:hypothetical protein [Actinophytocola xinjiangensis]|uniref:hypothetical protein n=1 Tax=Actinophytocola xinjiangensis TaxID=485602 RepID=UPI000B2498D1|nr:hypothetical protein [Actinophytocola xinjiangensis]